MKENMATGNAAVQQLLQASKKVFKVIAGNESSTRSCDQKKFVKVMTWIQLFLGFIAVCCALLGFVAAYEVKTRILMDRASNLLTHAQSDFYSSARENMERDYKEKRQMLHNFRQQMHSLKRNNCSGSANFNYNITPPRDQLNYPIIRRDNMEKAHCYGDFYTCLTTVDEDSSWMLEYYQLKIEYLGVPSWTGLMLIVTSVVGFYAVDNWTHPNGNCTIYLTYNIMNILCLLLFGPAMMTSACFQIAKADGSLPFRAALGRVTGVFAGLVLLVSLIVAVVFLLNRRNKQIKTTEEKKIPEGKEIPVASAIPEKVPLA